MILTQSTERVCLLEVEVDCADVGGRVPHADAVADGRPRAKVGPHEHVGQDRSHVQQRVPARKERK